MCPQHFDLLLSGCLLSEIRVPDCTRLSVVFDSGNAIVSSPVSCDATVNSRVSGNATVEDPVLGSGEKLSSHLHGPHYPADPVGG